MKGKPITYENLVVYPEYSGLSQEYLLKASKDGLYHIATWEHQNQNLAVIYKGGELIWTRPKCRLHGSESSKIAGHDFPVSLRLKDLGVLILICYELMFPQDYLLQNKTEYKTDVVVHMVGFPMVDQAQKEGWIAMQQTLSLLYKCPVVCCCGGPKGGMNLSGVILLV